MKIASVCVILFSSYAFFPGVNWTEITISKSFYLWYFFQENDYLVSHFDDDEDGLMDDDDMDEGPIYWVKCLLSELKDKQGNAICPRITGQLIAVVCPSDNPV